MSYKETFDALSKARVRDLKHRLCKVIEAILTKTKIESGIAEYLTLDTKSDTPFRKRAKASDKQKTLNELRAMVKIFQQKNGSSQPVGSSPGEIIGQARSVVRQARGMIL